MRGRDAKVKSKFVQYYVEGEDEEKLINVLKTDLKAIRPGKVQKLNVVAHEITNARLMTLRPGTMVVLVFDTDAGSINILNKNLTILKKCPAVSEIATVPQVLNLEQELVRSCCIKKAAELTGSKSGKDFKSDFIQTKNLTGKLLEHHFDIRQFWCGQPEKPYHNIANQAERIKLVGS